MADREAIRDGASNPKKREPFNRLAEHRDVLIAEIERAIKERQV